MNRDLMNQAALFTTDNPPNKFEVYAIISNIAVNKLDWKDINVFFPRVRTDIILGLLKEIQTDGWLTIEHNEANGRSEYHFLVSGSEGTKPYTKENYK